MIGLQAAIDSGARWLEFDVQLTADAVPVLMHDLELSRVAGKAVDVLGSTWDQLRSHSVGEAARFGDRYAHVFPARLEDACGLLATHPINAMIEFKPESVERHGLSAFLLSTGPLLAPLRRQVVVISYDPALLDAFRRDWDVRVGWIVGRYDDAAQATCADLNPDWVVCNQRKIAGRKRWPGDWRWALYVENDPKRCVMLLEEGIDLVETDDIGGVLEALGDA